MADVGECVDRVAHDRICDPLDVTGLPGDKHGHRVSLLCRWIRTLCGLFVVAGISRRHVHLDNRGNPVGDEWQCICEPTCAQYAQGTLQFHRQCDHRTRLDPWAFRWWNDLGPCHLCILVDGNGGNGDPDQPIVHLVAGVGGQIGNPWPGDPINRLPLSRASTGNIRIYTSPLGASDEVKPLGSDPCLAVSIPFLRTMELTV